MQKEGLCSSDPIFLEHAKVMQISMQIPTRQLPPGVVGQTSEEEEGSKVRVLTRAPLQRQGRGLRCRLGGVGV